MIEITKEPNADSRSNPNPSKEELREATKRHIEHVSQGLHFFADLLVEAAKKHDYLKIEKFEEFYEALISGKIKGSQWYEQHITDERHHLKSKIPDDVNLVDVFEHFIDCVVAGLSRSGEIYDVDIDSRVLSTAHENSIELLKANIKVLPSVSEDKIEDIKLGE